MRDSASNTVIISSNLTTSPQPFTITDFGSVQITFKNNSGATVYLHPYSNNANWKQYFSPHPITVAKSSTIAVNITKAVSANVACQYFVSKTNSGFGNDAKDNPSVIVLTGGKQ